jgi:hypothetical protein
VTGNTDRRGLAAETVSSATDKDNPMSTARTTRMLRELHSEPTAQFFQWAFTLLGLGIPPDPATEERDQRIQGAAELGSIA